MYAQAVFPLAIVAVATPAAAASNRMRGAPLIGRPFSFRRGDWIVNSISVGYFETRIEHLDVRSALSPDGGPATVRHHAFTPFWQHGAA